MVTDAKVKQAAAEMQLKEAKMKVSLSIFLSLMMSNSTRLLRNYRAIDKSEVKLL